MELPNIAAYAYQGGHMWSALLTWMRPKRSQKSYKKSFRTQAPKREGRLSLSMHGGSTFLCTSIMEQSHCTLQKQP